MTEEPLPDDAYARVPFLPGPSMRRTRLGASAFADAAGALQALLAEESVQPAPNSWLGEEIANATVHLPEEILLDADAEPDADSLHRRIQRLRRAGDLFVLTKAIESAKKALSPSSYSERLRVLAKGAHGLTTTSNRSRQRDLAFELMVAGWVGRFANEVALDEPDVTCRFEGERWGLACKTAYVGPASTREAIEGGIDQIERAGVDAGLVLVRVTDLYPHERLHWPPLPDRRALRTYVSEPALGGVANGLLAELVEGITRELQRGSAFATMQHSQQFRALAFLGHTFAYLLENGEPKPTLVPLNRCIIPREPPPGIAARLQESMCV